MNFATYTESDGNVVEDMSGRHGVVLMDITAEPEKHDHRFANGETTAVIVLFNDGSLEWVTLADCEPFDDENDYNEIWGGYSDPLDGMEYEG